MSAPSPAPRKRSRRGFWIVLVLLIAAGGWAWNAGLLPGRQSPPETTAEAAAPAEPEVMRLLPSEVVLLAPQRLTQTVRFSGSVTPARQVTISAQVSGLAEAVSVQSGQRVAEGEILIEIARSDLQLQLEAQEASLASSRAQLVVARAALDRAIAMTATGVASTSSLESAQGQVDVLLASIEAGESQVRLARTNLERATIRAPFAGTVSERSVDEGQLISAGSALLTLVDLSTVTVEAVAPLSDTLELAVGQRALLTLPGSNRDAFEARVERINPSAEQGTRSVKFFLALDNPEGLLRGGAFLTGLVELRFVENAIAVPRDAIRSSDGVSEVLVMADGVVSARAVTTGASWSSGALIEITEGLAAGETVLAMPLRGVSAGTRVTLDGN